METQNEPTTLNEPTATLETEPETKKRNNPILWIAGGLVLVLVLAGAAFMAGKLFNNRTAQDDFFPGDGPMVGAGPGKFVGGSVDSGVGEMKKLNILPAKELPTTQPDANGLFVRLEDNSVFIGTGRVTVAVTKKQGSSDTEMDANYDGPVVEVVVTKETKIYKEVTQLGKEGPSDEPIQQEVAPGTVEELGSNSTVSVWGKKVGDRIVADILLYSEPVFYSK